MKLNIRKIRREMKRMGLNQKDLCQLSGIKESTMSWLLANRRTTFGTLTKLAKALDVQPKDLLV